MQQGIQAIAGSFMAFYMLQYSPLTQIFEQNVAIALHLKKPKNPNGKSDIF